MTTYDPAAAGPRLWIPLAAASALGLAGLYLNLLPLTFLSALFTALALHNWPYAKPARVVLRLSDVGVDIDGIGHVPWNAVSRAGLLSLPMPKVAPRLIRIDLTAPIDHAVRPAPAFARPQWQKTLGRRMGEAALIIPVNGLLDEPQDVADAFETFLGARFYRLTPGFEA